MWLGKIGRRHLLIGWLVAFGVVTGLVSIFDAMAEVIERVEGTPLAGVYVVRPVKSNDAIHLRLMVQVGEADNRGTEGMAHYVEHLAWLSVHQAAERGVDRHSNARVTARSTSYGISGKLKDFPELVERILRVLEPFVLEEEFMLNERDIIQREYRYRVTDNPFSLLNDNLRRQVHGDHPFGRSVLGRPEDIEQFSLDEARAFHRKTHRPENAVLIVQGDVSRTKLRILLRRKFGSGSSVANTRLPKYAMAPVTRDVEIQYVDGLTRPVLLYRKMVRIPGPELETVSGLPELRQQLVLLRDVLASSVPGSLGRPLRFGNFVAESFRVGVGAFDFRHIQLKFFAHPDQGVSLETLLVAFETALSETAEDGIPVESFKRIRHRYIDRLERRDDPERFAFREVLSVVERRIGEAPRELSGYREYAHKIKREQVDSLIRLLAGPGRVVATKALPGDR